MSAITIPGYAGNKVFQRVGLQHNTSGTTEDPSIASSENQRDLSRRTANIVVLLALVLFTSLLLSVLYSLLAWFWAKQFVWIVTILHAVLTTGSVVAFCVLGSWPFGISIICVSAAHLICAYGYRRKIRFSTMVMLSVMDMVKRHAQVFGAAVVASFAAMVLAAWYSITVAFIWIRFRPEYNEGWRISACLLVLVITIVAFWTHEILKHVLYATASGVYACWYYRERFEAGSQKRATRSAFRRAATRSFGSICLGSLFLSFFHFVRRWGRNPVEQPSAEPRQGWSLFGCLKGVPQKMTAMGFERLMNELVISQVLALAATSTGFVCGTVAYVYGQFGPHPNKGNDALAAIAAVLSFFIGYQITSIFLTPIKSGLATLFVGAAFHPEVLMRDFQDLWIRTIDLYINIFEAVHQTYL
ncbi:MAG: putative choline transporter, neither null mutation nor overexpression affects choline transport [Lichina confinis]|nr:MAG: putative choline transporter, neither null mutation nor overexpression affects choline transport [Lichina confinis]